MNINSKDKFKKTVTVGLGMIMVLGGLGISGISAFAGQEGYGAEGASVDESYTLEEMLEYAIEDEFLARSEYEVIIETYGDQRPFSNIVEAEKTHIDLLIPLFEEYGIDLPSDTASSHTLVPESIQSALEVGVQAEIDNIAMYEKFLSGDLPDDVREVFEELKKASESHLSAFQRGTSRNGGSGEGFISNGKGGNGTGEMAKTRADGNGNNADRNGEGFAVKANGEKGQGQGQGNMVRAQDGTGENANSYGLGSGMKRAGRSR